MTTVNMLEAKNTLSTLVELVASGRQREITIARHGKPAARLVPLRSSLPGQRIGAAKGRFQMPADVDVSAEEAAVLFTTTGSGASR